MTRLGLQIDFEVGVLQDNSPLVNQWTSEIGLSRLGSMRLGIIVKMEMSS